MDLKNIGLQIANLRKLKGLTQAELGERLSISYQAISKWERGETLPDVTILPDLACILETTVDFILTGYEKLVEYKGKVSVYDLAEGLKCLAKMRTLLGKDHPIYVLAIDGINKGMNTDIEEIFTSDFAFDAFLAEAIIQSVMNGKYVDPTEVKNAFKTEKFKKIALEYCSKYGIK